MGEMAYWAIQQAKRLQAGFQANAQEAAQGEAQDPQQARACNSTDKPAETCGSEGGEVV